MIDYEDKIALGMKQDFYRYVSGKGTIGTVETTLNDLGNSVTITEMTTIGALKISSSSANDTAAGTGARTVLVRGLDADWNIVEDIVSLNGQTGVALTNVVLHPFLIMVLTAGTGQNNDGKLYVGSGTITSGVPAVINVACSELKNQSRYAFMPVPRGYSCVVKNIGGYSNANQMAIINGVFKPYGGVYLTGASIELSSTDSREERKILTPALPEKTLLKLTGVAATGTSVIGGYINLLFHKV